MKIPRNFDRWMFDYKEGNLSQSETSYFENHMAENPQLDADISAWENAYVKKEAVAYSGMAGLQRERKFGVWFGWAASITVLITTSFSTFYFMNNDNSQYSLRDSGLEKISIPTYSPYSTDNNLYSNYISNLDNENISTPHSQIQNSVDPIYNLAQTGTSSNSINDQDAVSAENNTGHKKSTAVVSDNLIENEIAKIKGDEINNAGSYKSNPKYKESEKNKSRKSKSNYGSFSYKLKKILKKIEKMSGYPVGITNLKDPEILYPHQSLLDQNGSFAGSFGTERFESKYRNQWFGSQNNLQSLSLSFDTYSKSIRAGLGVSFNKSDFNNGLYTDNRLNFFYSPKFAISKKIIFEPSIKMSLGLMSSNQSKIENDSPIEVERGRIIKPKILNEGITANNQWYKDYALGFILNADKFYFGFNANNLAKHNQNIYNEKSTALIEYNGFVGMDYQSRNKKTILSPFISYNHNYLANEFWGGLNIKYQMITLGGAYSSKNDYSGTIGVKMRTFKLVYQYDRTDSFLTNEKIGSHTIGIRINTKRKN